MASQHFLAESAVNLIRNRLAEDDEKMSSLPQNPVLFQIQKLGKS